MWIESHDTLVRHPKLYALCDALQIKPAQAIGHLHCFWWWCMSYAPEGSLDSTTASMIARASEYDGDAVKFLEALVTSGFVDDKNGRKTVHNWGRYAGKLIAFRESERKRLRAHRKNVKRMENVRRTNGEQTPPTDTVPLPTRSNIPPVAPQGGGDTATAATEKYYPEAFERFWAAYPERKGKGAALRAWKKHKLHEGDLPDLLAGIEEWKKSREWLDGFIAHASTWLSERRWEDEPEDATRPKLDPKYKAQAPQPM